jgi:hypothetical protein
VESSNEDVLKTIDVKKTIDKKKNLFQPFLSNKSSKKNKSEKEKRKINKSGSFHSSSSDSEGKVDFHEMQLPENKFLREVSKDLSQDDQKKFLFWLLRLAESRNHKTMFLTKQNAQTKQNDQNSDDSNERSDDGTGNLQISFSTSVFSMKSETFHEESSVGGRSSSNLVKKQLETFIEKSIKEPFPSKMRLLNSLANVFVFLFFFVSILVVGVIVYLKM